jgi:dihydroxyacetone kinase
VSAIAESGPFPGAIISIFLAGITAETRQSNGLAPDSVEFWSEVVGRALLSLQRATPARKGHRTMMDALIPFVETLQRTGDLEAAVNAAKEGAESTVPMTAKLGRYVG